MDQTNPTIPATYDVVWSIAMLATFVLMAIAIVVLVRSWRRMPPILAIAWLVIVVMVPLLGPIAWLGLGRPSLGRAPLPNPGSPV